MKAQSRVSEEEATKRIKKKDNIFSAKKNVEKLELIYLDYYLFKVEIELKKQKIIQHICVDTLKGEWALVKKEELNLISEKIKETRENNLTQVQAEKIATENIRNILMAQKNKRNNLLEIKTNFEHIIKYPYWIGYFKRKKGVDFEVIDAVNGKKQGVKMKPLFIEFIIQ